MSSFSIEHQRDASAMSSFSIGHQRVASDVEDGNISDVEDGNIIDDPSPPSAMLRKESCLPFSQKLFAEFVGTFYMVFVGCGAIIVNENYGKVVTLPGIAFAWGFGVMAIVYSVGHISGAHLNPAVTIAFASCNRFPFIQVPAYIVAQVLGSTAASEALRLIFSLNNDVCSRKHDVFIGSYPSGTSGQSFAVEFICTLHLMFVITAVATDDRAKVDFAGLIIGATVTINILFAGPVSGTSLNPARSLGPAIVWGCYKRIWIYIAAPILGASSGAWLYNILRYTDKPFQHIKPLQSIRNASTRNNIIEDGTRNREGLRGRVCVIRCVDPHMFEQFQEFVASQPNAVPASSHNNTNIICKIE